MIIIKITNNKLLNNNNNNNTNIIWIYFLRGIPIKIIIFVYNNYYYYIQILSIKKYN